MKPVENDQTAALEMWTNDTDYVIAGSAEETREIIRELYGEPLSDDEIGELSRLDEGSEFDFHHHDGRIETKTVAEWISQQGRGYFACSEV